MAAIPVDATGRMIRGAGERAEGIRLESASSILSRKVEAEIIFALYSPNGTEGCQL